MDNPALLKLFSEASGSHEQAILRLRKGDTVVFGRKTFKLGEFLGAGNTTHVFALEDYPDRVIRIPFHVKPLQFREAEFLRRFKAGHANSPHKKVKILDSEDFYIITSRVNGGLNAQDFFDSINLKYRPGNSTNLLKIELWLENAIRKVEKEDRDLRILKQLKKIKPILWDDLSQFIWDEKKEDWYQVDFE